MALQTDLNVFPYYDDFDPAKDYYRVLFKPGVAVQARELNQLQAILQNQIEKFGDNIFKRGTIIEGCNITRHPILPYVKIKDTETDGTPVNVSMYQNLSVRNALNVTGYIVSTADGFESRAPDLNTLFVKYNSSGDNFDTATFSESDTLTVYDANYPIFKTRVINGSDLVSNTDATVFLSALAVQNSTGGTTFPASSFVVGNWIQNGVANAIIVEANTTANSEVLILKIRPSSNDLITANTTKWRFGSGENIRNANTSNTAKVVAIIGSKAEGSILTDSLGKITSISMTNMGSGYYVPPHVTVMKTGTSSLSATEIDTLDITALNYLATVTVANSSLSPVGVGYGVTVDEGTIYQKGFFSRVSQQLAVVNKYSNTGFDKSVGFDTVEELVDSNEDQTLLDNATGTYNYAAPGADRLKLTPTLRVLSKEEADANTDFLPVIEFADGRPYVQNPSTVYNVIGDVIAQRTYEESGNYVIDRFNVALRDSATFADSSSLFKMVIDPGKAYINGYRVETVDNYVASINKGTDTDTNESATTQLGFGNFIKVKQLGGSFPFNIAASVDLYTVAATYITSSAGSAISPAGTKIGTARIRSLTLHEGEPGTPNCRYKLYLFDVVMNNGKNFADVRSIYYNGTNKGIADVVLDARGKASLEDTSSSTLLFNNIPAVKSVSNVNYTYRTVDQTETANTTGYIELNLAAGEYFPYTGALSSTSKRDLLVIPRADYQASAAATGTIACNTASATVTGAAGTNFINVFKAGDFALFANSTGGETFVRQVSQVTGASSMIMTSSGAANITGGSVTLYFPKNVPISLNSNPNRYANVSVSNSQVMTIYLANSIANSTGGSSSANVTVIYNATRQNVSSAVKSSSRGVYTRVVTSNNAGGVRGPWALGLADAYRMRKVYVANGASRAVSFDANTDIASSGTSSARISLTNNAFANGDSFTYADNTTTLGGLTDGVTYYAVYANSTGMSLSATRGGANITITASSTSENHTVTGQPIFFTSDTYGVSEVTNDFYIDTNQKEDYLDTSYLYRKPRATSLTSNDVLLVQYDVFTGGDSSIKTISSYPIDDTLSFNSLVASANVHTMEIPEVLGTTGVYYDLRDQYDFRPRSANTINLITEISTVAAGANAASIINPGEPTTANRFTSAEKYFPAPDTTLTANVEYYLGRTDRVVVDSAGNFVVRTGTPGLIDEVPTEPKNSITLQIIRIPQYPSLPKSGSSDMAKIIDTKIANESYSKRESRYTVSTQLSATAQTRIQTRGYKMSDIASLESRIQTLEYYVSFTLAEALANARFIPSSLDALTDRFRFGFFVDPFTDYNYSDLSNPEFYATIQEDMLSPKLTEINLEFAPDDGSSGILTLPYNEFTIISQNDATDGPVLETEVTTTSVTQITSTVIQNQRSTSRSDDGTIYEEFFYTFSSLAGPVEFYCNCRDNNTALEVYQATSLNGDYAVAYSSASASAVTSADITAKSLSTLNYGEKFEDPGVLNRKSYGPAGGFIEDHFKLTWLHNPTNGIYYKLRIYKGKRHGNDAPRGTYAYKLYYPSDLIETSTSSVTNASTFTYNGVVHTVSPRDFTITLTNRYSPYIGFYNLFNNNTYFADSQKFTISVVGLKPNTYHKFKFNSEDKTSKCSQTRDSTTNTTGLLSDVNGVLNFDFYYDAGIDEATTDLEQRNKLAAAVAGTKSFIIESIDGSSKATGTIGMRYYTNMVFNNAQPLNVSSTGTGAAVNEDQNVNINVNSLVSQALNDAIDSNNVRVADISNDGILSDQYPITY